MNLIKLIDWKGLLKIFKGKSLFKMKIKAYKIRIYMEET